MHHREKNSYATRGRKSQAHASKYNNKPTSLSSIEVLPCAQIYWYLIRNFLMKFPLVIDGGFRTLNSQFCGAYPQTSLKKKQKHFKSQNLTNSRWTSHGSTKVESTPLGSCHGRMLTQTLKIKTSTSLPSRAVVSCRARQLWKRHHCSLRWRDTGDPENTDARQCMLPSFDVGHGGATEMQASTRRGVDNTIFRQTWR